jgi:murein DD-endopeptidase MepM/ murein hydrolase activator NlpD
MNLHSEGTAMAFVLFATGACSRSPVRALSLRPLLGGAALAALALLGAGGGVGYWLAAPQGSPVPLPLAAAAPEAPKASHPFTLEQLGAISGRLFRLESEAAQLSRRIGILQKDAPVIPRATGATTGATGATGGPLLPPRSQAALDLDALDEQIDRVEEQIALVAEAAVHRNVELMRLPTRRPIPGAELTSSFGNRSDPFAHRHAFHAGLDFAAGHGTPIASAAGGKVAYAGFRSDYGGVVEIDHGNGLVTRYAHASKLLVRTGQLVVPGHRIALVGSTGRSTGPHLHFEVIRRGGHVDPKRYLAGL